AYAFEVVGLELQAVADAELHAGLLAGIDHLLAALDGDLERLLAVHMLARGRGGQRVLHVQRIRRHHVDDVDVLVLGHLVHRVVGVHIARGNVVLLLPLGGLRRRARDDAGEAAIAGLEQRRRDLVRREAPEAAQRHAELARGRLTVGRRKQREGGEGGGVCQKAATGGVGHGVPVLPEVYRRRSLAEPAEISVGVRNRFRATRYPRMQVTTWDGRMPGNTRNYLKRMGVGLASLLSVLAGCTAGNGEG